MSFSSFMLTRLLVSCSGLLWAAMLMRLYGCLASLTFLGDILYSRLPIPLALAISLLPLPEQSLSLACRNCVIEVSIVSGRHALGSEI